MKRLTALAVASVVATMLLAGALTSPARADVGPAASYIFVIDASSLRVIPAKGNSARIVLTDPRALRFTGDPYPLVRQISARGVLLRLGWSEATSQFPRRAPLASISIAGERSRVVALGKAQFREGKLILRGYGIDGPLTKAQGPGSAFINNPAAYP